MIVKVYLILLFRASAINCYKVSTTVMRKKFFIEISSPRIYWFPKTTFSKLPILDLLEPQVFQSRDTHTKLLLFGIAHLMFFSGHKNTPAQLTSGQLGVFSHKQSIWDPCSLDRNSKTNLWRFSRYLALQMSQLGRDSNNCLTGKTTSSTSTIRFHSIR